MLTGSFSGTTQVRRITLNRAGSFEPNWNTSFGGLWVFADDGNISAPVTIDTLSINGSTYEGILFSYNKSISNISLNNVQVNGAGTYGLNFSAVTGSGSFSNVSVSGTGSALNNPGNVYTINRGPGNMGW